MNFLLRQLKADGTMLNDCIAVSSRGQAELLMESAAGRAIMHMGTGVRPGPFWVVHGSDVESLVAAGYTLIELARSIPPE